MSDYQTQIRGEYADDDGREIDMGAIPERTAWWEIPLPKCPDCGGNVEWFEAGYAPGTRKCLGCGSMFSVQTADGRALLRRERFYD